MQLIRHIVSDFHYTTGLSIQFFNRDLEPLAQMGNCCPLPHVRLARDLEKLSTMSLLNYNGQRFLAIPFDAPPHISGYFVAGPFHCGGSSILHMDYRPSHCVPYLEGVFEHVLTKQLAADPGYDSHILRAIQYLKENYQKPIALDDICHHLGLNKNYFCGLFKTNTGKTFNQYLTELRVEESKRLLKASKASIIDVSLAVGFNNHTHFSQTFKKLTGMTPTAFKKQPCPVLEGFTKRKK